MAFTRRILFSLALGATLSFGAVDAALLGLIPSDATVVSGVHVEQVDPPTLDLTWEDVVVRDVPIQVSVVGAPSQATSARKLVV